MTVSAYSPTSFEAPGIVGMMMPTHAESSCRMPA
jgi:hypothetical protein